MKVIILLLVGERQPVGAAPPLVELRLVRKAHPADGLVGDPQHVLFLSRTWQIF